jgi:ABC-2 type transport system permease protein
MRSALIVALKDLRLRVRDRSAIVLAFVAPVLLAVIISSAFGSAGPSVRLEANIAVLNLDQGELGRAFTDGVLRAPEIRRLVHVHPVRDERMVRARARETSGLIVPSGFTQAVRSGGEARIVVLKEEGSFSGEIAKALADGFVAQVAASRLSVATAANGDFGRIADLAARVAAERIPVRLAGDPPGGGRVGIANFMGPGMAIFFLFFTVQYGSRSILAERQAGTLQRLVAAPMRPGTVLVGKVLAVSVMALASFSVMFVAMGLLFGVRWGDPLALGALSVATVFAVLGLTALVASLARTEEQAGAWGSILGVVLGLLGGNFFPIYQMPALMQRLTFLTPNGWALRGFTDLVYEGGGIASVVPNLAAIVAFGLVTGWIAMRRIRRVLMIA